MMKVSSDPAQVSALNTWLRDPEAMETTSAATPAADSAPHAAPASSTAQSRDTAEVLLDLDVWNGTPGAARRLATAAAAPQPEQSPSVNPAHQWADHILEPLQ
jgi:hypothetical protein